MARSCGRAWMLSLALALSCTCVAVRGGHCQTPDVERVHAVGINPVKLIMGLANVEYELRATHHAGLQVLAEYQLRQRVDHPDVVVRGGVRYYPYPTDQALRSVYAGANGGLSWSKPPGAEDEGVFFGSAFGSRFIFGDRFFVAPRVVVHYLISRERILWGLEAPVGVMF